MEMLLVAAGRDAANSNADALPRRSIPKKKSTLFGSFTRKRNHHPKYSPQNHSRSLTSNPFPEGDSSHILGRNNYDDNFKEAHEDEGRSAAGRHRQIERPSTVPSGGSFSVLGDGEGEGLILEAQTSSHVDLETELARLGKSPSSSEPANVPAARAKEHMNEYLISDNVLRVLDRKKWESIPEFAKSDLKIQKHLGKGSFSDAFEVSVTVATEKKKLDSSDKEDLDEPIEAKFVTSNNDSKEEEAKDDLDRQIEAMFAPPSAPTKPVSQRPGRSGRQTMNQGASASFCVHGTQASTGPVQKKVTTYAMKCLRPKIRSNAEQFAIGIEDLVHEATMLASLDHPNIIKIHGRAVTDSSRLGDGYFILLDRLQHTLEEQIKKWKVLRESETGLARMGRTGGASPWLGQLEAGSSVANALSYLHSKNVVFRDLKPANVGFDSRGVVKLFDFGFSVVVESDANRLYDICGTPRYMAPEFGLGRGYSFPVDVHSFGILLWEILSLKRPFGHIKSNEALQKQVFERGVRPKMERGWHQCLKCVMRGCWSTEPVERPTMEVVAGMLRGHTREVTPTPLQRSSNVRLLS